MMDGKSIRNKLIGSDDERAVSPVIGVILMVAITVILAAVIAAFVLDMGDPGGSSVQASASISGSGTDSVEISISDAGSADNIVIVDPSNGAVVSDSSSEPANTGATYTVNAGSSTASNSSADFGADFNGDFNVYAIGGDLSGGDQLDSADGNIKIGEFEIAP